MTQGDKSFSFKRKLDQNLDLAGLIEAHQVGKFQRYPRGGIIYWQGDPVEYLFVVKEGAIKVSSLSADGKTYTYNVLGPGGLAGAQAFLLNKNHETLAEALKDTEVFALFPEEFEQLLNKDPHFSMLVMKKMAQEVHLLSGKMRDLGFLDVQQRLKSHLSQLAVDHGMVRDKGIEIDLDITHAELSEMLAANRTTITACLSELRRQGYLWKEGRHLVIIPLEQMEILDNLEQAILEGSEEEARQLILDSIDQKIDPLKTMEAMTTAMKRVDRMFSRNEIDTSDIILAAYAMKSTIPIIEEQIVRTGKAVSYLGTIVIGTVYGDIHDIGRTMVSMLLKARGFQVIDLGVDVPVAKFVDAVRKVRPHLVAMSTLMTTTAPEPPKVIQALIGEGLRDKVKVMVGGAAMTKKMMEDIGADGYEPTAHKAVELAWRLIHQ